MKALISILVLLISFSLKAKEEKNCDDLIEVLKNIPQEINDYNHYDYKPQSHARNATEKAFDTDTIGIILSTMKGTKINENGALIRDVALASPIYFADVKSGDFVKSINGIKISKESLYNYASEQNIDPDITNSLYRKSFGIFPDYKLDQKNNTINQIYNEYTFKHTDKGYEINLVVEDSPAWKKGMRPGSIITKLIDKQDEVLLDKENLEKRLKEEFILKEDYQNYLQWKFSGLRGQPRDDELEIMVINPGDNLEKKIILKTEKVKLPLNYWHATRFVYEMLLLNKIDEIEIYLTEEDKIVTLNPQNKIVKYPINLLFRFYPNIVSIDTKKNQFSINSELSYWYFDRILADYIRSLGFDKEISCQINGEIDTNYSNFPDKVKIQNVLEETNKRIKYNFRFEPKESFEEKNAFLEEAETDELSNYMLMQTDNSFRFLKTIISDIDFKNILNLREFPFDNHEMKIDIINKDKINFRLDEVYLGQNRYWQDYIKNNKLSDWKINDTSIDLAHFHNKEFSSGIDSYFFRIGYNEKYKNAEKKIFTIFVEREYNYYLIKILIPIIIILIVCWSVFWINISQIESRLTISVVCLLALIAYNVIVADSLPMIGYATVMDYIILSSYVLGALSTLLTVIFYNFHVRDYDIIRTEKITRLTLPVIYIAIVYGIIDYNIARLDTAVIGKFLLGLLNF